MARVRLCFAFALCCVSFAGSVSAAEIGHASWYALTTPTASGERCNPNALTAAHPTLPFDTKVEVRNVENGKSVVVRINDRGPFVAGRIIDVTRATAARLGFIRDGVTTVQLRVIGD
jgi:rare lipoprotein A